MNHFELIALKTEANELAFTTYDQCRELLDFVMPISPEMKLDWSQRRDRSNGGRNRISIGMRRYTIKYWAYENWSVSFLKQCFGNEHNSLHVHPEYARFQYDPEIGSFTSDTFHAGLVAVICHEFAHSLVANAKMAKMEKYINAAPHGQQWQNVYRILRRRLVNETYEIRKVVKP